MGKDPEERTREFLKRLEEAGEPKVRENLAHERYGPRSSPDARMAENWVEDQRLAREEADRIAALDQGAKQVGLAEDANRIAREANDISREAKTAAQWAGAGAALAAMIATAAFLRTCG